MPLEKPAAGELVAALLDKKDFQSLEVTLCCKDERRKSFRFHRRFDPYQDAMYVVADELPAERAAPIRAGRLARMDALGTFAAEQTGCGPRSSVSDERRVTLPDGLQPGLP
jgi:hypothetical protein